MNHMNTFVAMEKNRVRGMYCMSASANLENALLLLGNKTQTPEPSKTARGNVI